MHIFKTASFEILIFFHIEPHGKEKSLEATDEAKHQQQCIHIRDITTCRPYVDESDGKGYAGKQQDKGK